MSSTEHAFQLLEIGFEGYFTSRIATDPDPTNEERGMSGYTMALPNEDRLDQVIRLQADEAFWAKNARKPLHKMPKVKDGVRVTSVTFDGAPWPAGEDALIGGKVYLDGRDEPLRGAVFESRNNITGSDDTMSFVIDPFKLRIEKGTVQVTAQDYIDPRDPSRQLWQIVDPSVYARRLTKCWDVNDVEVAEATGVFDPYGYFRDRRRLLEKYMIACQRRIDKESSKRNPDKRRIEHFEARKQAYATRIYQLEFWGDRVISKLQTRCDWEFDINGPQAVRSGDALGGSVRTDQPWHTRFWFGGWDGDLLIGYMRGTLRMPFVPKR